MDLYSENILHHYKNPQNKGRIKSATISAEDVNPLCGDKIRIDLKIVDDKIAEISFDGEGCAISQASASMLTEEVVGKSLREGIEIGNQQIYDMLGVPLTSARVKCALLALVVLKKALTLYKFKDAKKD